MKVGIISDTHGKLRPEALAALQGCELILHAGDVGSVAVLEGLRALAPVVAVRGNCDRGEWAEALPETQTAEAGGILFYMIHDLKRLDRETVPAGVRCIVSGHTHKALLRSEGDLTYLNPGSAGPRRFSLPLTLALLQAEKGEMATELVTLELHSGK